MSSAPSKPGGYAYIQSLQEKILTFLDISMTGLTLLGGFGAVCMLELIHLYKAQEIADPTKYTYHYYLRPPMTRGHDFKWEAKLNGNTMV